MAQVLVQAQRSCEAANAVENGGINYVRAMGLAEEAKTSLGKIKVQVLEDSDKARVDAAKDVVGKLCTGIKSQYLLFAAGKRREVAEEHEQLVKNARERGDTSVERENLVRACCARDTEFDAYRELLKKRLISEVVITEYIESKAKVAKDMKEKHFARVSALDEPGRIVLEKHLAKGKAEKGNAESCIIAGVGAERLGKHTDASRCFEAAAVHFRKAERIFKEVVDGKAVIEARMFRLVYQTRAKKNETLAALKAGNGADVKKHFDEHKDLFFKTIEEARKNGCVPNDDTCKAMQMPSFVGKKLK
ncbi:MAG: hypothetical protein LBI61_00280 [Puniceicoccales bacterium]|nr:hypothetical protein [Puniceicoccales bacterium]